ncbi:MAG: UDP-N-acetylmuramoyl-L-alanyl-D-glutamate--2,6-diaminopimelate ligase, partial [Anaerolineae bacterium]
MQLGSLLGALPEYTVQNKADIEITHITEDSRRVTPGALFVAIRGVEVDGARFIPDALARGAVAIVAEQPYPLVPPLTHPPAWIIVRDSRAALAYLCAAWHNFPTHNLRVIGVTGTDGKTTTSTLIENILLAAGHTVGTVTTVAAHIGGREIDTGFHTTTPDAPAIQDYMAQMVAAGTEYAVIESTSHGLAQHRLDAVDFDIAVVTNITHEHLDFHGDWENYREAKAMLFRALATTRRKPRTAKVAVLNADDNTRGVFDFLRALPADEKIIYGLERTADNPARAPAGESEKWIFARDIHPTPAGMSFTVDTPFGELAINSPLVGNFNVSNILAAAGVGLARRIPFDAIQRGIALTRGISGRMEHIDRGQPFMVIVDFAHTPNALERVLETVRGLTAGRVIVVFGAAGLRDVQKRPWMGNIAGRLADLTVVTAEDPRTESLDTINAAIADGLEKAGRQRDRDYYIVDDRAEAIRFAIQQLARPGDLVIMTGKGHER